MGKHGLPLVERIMARVVIDPCGCWLWQGSTVDGYGTINVSGRIVRVHRLMYELTVGPIPEGHELDHVRERGCRHRHCCNPAHLEPVTHRDNVLRGDGIAARNARKTHCKRGHEFTEANTYRRRDRPGNRECKACWS